MVYYAEVNCEAVNCKNKAYWETSKGYLCGVHSKKLERTQLEKDPNKKEKKKAELLEHENSVLRATQENQAKKQSGELIVSKLRMMAPVPHQAGYKSVFPNYKHGKRSDGLGLPSLSPKSLGPIEHGMEGVPVALSLENFHQGSKFFLHELDEEGNPTEAALKFRNEFFQDPEPHRHKFERKQLPKNNPNIPEFSFLYGKKFNYLESRWFYCVWYEHLADYEMLLKLMQEGTNLNIIGYDGYPIPEGDDLKEVLMQCYQDTSKPFGHEMVLATMLLLEKKEDYPWNRFRPELYEPEWNPNK